MQTKGAKSLLVYDGMAVLDHQIKTILGYDKKADILIVSGVGHEKIVKHIDKKNYDIRILFNYNYKLTSQTESLRLAMNAVRPESVYIIHGDIIFNEASLCCSQTKSAIMLDPTQSDKKYIGATYHNGILMNLSYGLEEKWAQIAFLSKKDFPSARKVINSFKNNKMTFEFINMLTKHTKFSIIYDGIKTLEISRNYEDTSN
jgi:choline kinase